MKYRGRSSPLFPNNLHGHIPNCSTVRIPGTYTNHICLVHIPSHEWIGLASPRTIPVNSTYLGVLVIQIDSTLSPRRCIWSPTRVDVFRRAWRDGNFVDVGGWDLFVFVVTFVKFAPRLKMLSSYNPLGRRDPERSKITYQFRVAFLMLIFSDLK